MRASWCSDRDQIVELLRLFLAESTNEARVVDQADTHHQAGRRARASCASCAASTDHWEVRRILKAYVDAQTLSDFAGKLPEYAGASSAGRWRR